MYELVVEDEHEIILEDELVETYTLVDIEVQVVILDEDVDMRRIYSSMMTIKITSIIIV